jgi:hypothetical protein
MNQDYCSSFQTIGHLPRPLGGEGRGEGDFGRNGGQVHGKPPHPKSDVHWDHEPRSYVACVLECGGLDAAFGGISYPLPPSCEPFYRENRTIASPSLPRRLSGSGGEGRGSNERGECLLLCCSFVGELSPAEARGSDQSVHGKGEPFEPQCCPHSWICLFFC